MSEYQRYEFMTSDRPLTRAQLEAVNNLSSHIEASSTHALIEYHWGDFKHDPIKVLRRFFDGFLYWANWGSPELALRFPHGLLPTHLLNGYDLDGFVTFTRYADYDILDIEFGELEAPDEWIDYELGSLMPIRDELMEGDLRSLYIVWLASRSRHGGYRRDLDEDDDEDDGDEYDDEEEDEEDEEEEYEDEEGEDGKRDETSVPPVPFAFKSLTAAQQALAELLRVPSELLGAAARHSKAAPASVKDDFAAWIKLLPPDRSNDFLLRLAHNEPALSHLFVRELRELGRNKTSTILPTGECVPFATLLAESKVIKDELERERRRREQEARQKRLQEVHSYQDTYWQQVDKAVTRGTSSGYDEALRLLLELRAAADLFQESQKFQKRFFAWVEPHLRRPAFVRRLQAKKFSLPEA